MRFIRFDIHDMSILKCVLMQFNLELCNLFIVTLYSPFDNNYADVHKNEWKLNTPLTYRRNKKNAKKV